MGFRWCPSCRAEYVAGIETCADCGVVLVDELDETDPEAVVGPSAARRWDGAHLTEHQRQTLTWMLGSHDIPHSWSGTDLLSGSPHEADVDELIEFVSAPPSASAADDFAVAEGDGPEDDTDAVDEVVAAPHIRRAVAWWIDRLLIGVCTWPIGLTFHGWRFVVVSTAVWVVYQAVAVAGWSTTIGKAVLGLSVVPVEPRESLGLGAAMIRGLVPQVAIVAVFLPFAVEWVLGIGWQLLTYGPILWRIDRRGLHDLAAGSQVVLR